MDSDIVNLLNSVPIIIISEHDDGDSKRHHKKKRIRKKWRKRYGTISAVLKAGHFLSLSEPNPVIYMSRKTYAKLKGGQYGK